MTLYTATSITLNLAAAFLTLFYIIRLTFFPGEPSHTGLLSIKRSLLNQHIVRKRA